MSRGALAAALMLPMAAAAAPITLDDAAEQQLDRVQHWVGTLPSRSDQDRFGRIDYWEAADATGGDCEDKALAARQALIALGWPPAALRLALAWDETGTWHAVLTIDAIRAGHDATYVLDSRFKDIETWSALVRRGYRWALRQGERGGWRQVGP